MVKATLNGTAQCSRTAEFASSQLEEIQQYMQASRVIAVSFRLEATQTDEYQGILDDMADNIDVFSEKIKQHVIGAKTYIDRLLQS